MPKILLVDDDDELCHTVGQMLEILGHEVSIAHSLHSAKKTLKSHEFDHVFLDFMLPDGSGLHLIDDYKHIDNAPFITLITGHPSVKKMMVGLCGRRVNHLIKPLCLDDLKAALDHENSHKRKATDIVEHFGSLIGESNVMYDVYRMIERVSRTRANVMLFGESGVGKEVVAQAIHTACGRKHPLIAVNCGAFSRELISSELFGHEKGAFTGAVARKRGVFEQANEGTLFLDEVTEMPLDTQPNLLRVLETGRVVRVGGVNDFEVNCRVISATNRDAEDLAKNNILREDLYFRLAVFPIAIPPLRERTGDVPLLSKAFIDQLNDENETNFVLSKKQLDILSAYDWPGNVRELRHFLHRACIMSDPTSDHVDLPNDLRSPFTKKVAVKNQIKAGQTIDDIEKQLIIATLDQLAGDKPKAAEMLGISLKTLYNRLSKYEQLEP